MIEYLAGVIVYCAAMGGLECGAPPAAAQAVAQRTECASAPKGHQPIVASRVDGQGNSTVLRAIELLRLPAALHPVVELFAPGRFPKFERELAFRVWRGSCLDRVIYINPRHPLYQEAAEAGSDSYPLYVLASVLVHEMQHGEADYSEGAALAVQVGYLRRVLPLISPQRRSNARAYIQALEERMQELDRSASDVKLTRQDR